MSYAYLRRNLSAEIFRNISYYFSIFLCQLDFYFCAPSSSVLNWGSSYWTILIEEEHVQRILLASLYCQYRGSTGKLHKSVWLNKESTRKHLWRVVSFTYWVLGRWDSVEVTYKWRSLWDMYGWIFNINQVYSYRSLLGKVSHKLLTNFTDI